MVLNTFPWFHSLPSSISNNSKYQSFLSGLYILATPQYNKWCEKIFLK